MVYLTNGTLGFVNESTYGIRIEENGAAASTVTWACGDYIGSFQIPKEKPGFIDKGAFTSFDYGELISGSKHVEFEINYLLMEGHCLWYVLGTIAEAGSDNNYTHTITGLLPSVGIELPSRTFHIQLESLTTDKLIDISGCITQSIDIGGSAKDPGIKVKEKIVAQRITDEGGTQVLTGEVLTAAIDYTAAPAYMDSQLTSEDYYYLESIVLNIAGGGNVDITPFVDTWNINISNELLPRRSNSAGEDNYGRSINNYVGAWYLKRRRYTITLNVLPSDETVLLWDSCQDQVTDNALTITFTRKKATGGETDNIVFDFDNNPAVCPVVDVTAIANFALANDNTWTFVLQPKALVDIVVTDDVSDYEVVPS